jgi:hypothetical protein
MSEALRCISLLFVWTALHLPVAVDVYTLVSFLYILIYVLRKLAGLPQAAIFYNGLHHTCYIHLDQ